MYKIISFLLAFIFCNQLSAQKSDFKKANEFFELCRVDYSGEAVDSIIEYNLQTKTRTILTFPIDTLDWNIPPHIGDYNAVDLQEFDQLPKRSEDEEISLLFRTRDVMEGVNHYPASAVTKMLKYKQGQIESGCTATFINERFLITAAHCVLNIRTKKHPEKIELKVLFDNGEAAQTVSVKKVYYKKHYEESWIDGNCFDIALVEIEEPIGKETGYLGIQSQHNMECEINTWKSLYSFTYPHVSFTHQMEKQMQEETNDSIREKLAKQISDQNNKNQDFNKDNQYLEVVRLFIKDEEKLQYKGLSSIAGQSGAAKISADYYLYGVISVHIGDYDMNMDCRLRKELLNSFIQIIKNAENGKEN